MSKFSYIQIHDQRIFGGILWNNKDIPIRGQSLFNLDWYQKGIFYIKDILDKNHKMMSIPELQNQYDWIG